jgi:hypothetical protein
MFKKGDLAWAPSDTTLVKLDDFGETVTHWCRITVPTHVVVLSEQDGPYHEVLYRSEKWLARTLDMYQINKEEVNSNVG